jgi:MerR family Zn(II)-responsive transcriptional regulator of zntA
MGETKQTIAYQIGELAKQTGVSLRTIRFYQQKEMIIPSFRTSSGMSLYSASDVERIKLIRRLRNTGMRLEEIKDILHTDRTSDRKSKVEHTLKVLSIEAENAKKRIIELEKQSRDREQIIKMIKKCLDCERASCPEECPPRVHIIQ